MKWPPSSGQVFKNGSRERSGGVCTCWVMGPLALVFMPSLSAAETRFLCGQILLGESEGKSWASCTNWFINCSGREPKAKSTRFFVPKRLVTQGKSAPSTFSKSRAGPAAAMTRRWISAISRSEETGVSTRTSSPPRCRISRNWRRLCMDGPSREVGRSIILEYIKLRPTEQHRILSRRHDVKKNMAHRPCRVDGPCRGIAPMGDYSRPGYASSR